jgi:hypothetical protein
MIAQHSNSRLLMLLLVAAGIAIAIGCSSSEDSSEASAPASTQAEAVPTPTPNKSPAPSGQVSMSDAERKRVGKVEGGLGVTRITPRQGSNTIELPSDFPSDVPLHPDSSPTSYIASKSGRRVTTLVASVTPESVRSYYPSALEGEGWAIRSNGAGDELMIVSASKDRRNISVAISEESGKTTIKLIEGTK